MGFALRGVGRARSTRNASHKSGIFKSTTCRHSGRNARVQLLYRPALVEATAWPLSAIIAHGCGPHLGHESAGGTYLCCKNATRLPRPAMPQTARIRPFAAYWREPPSYAFFRARTISELPTGSGTRPVSFCSHRERAYTERLMNAGGICGVPGRAPNSFSFPRTSNFGMTSQ